MNDKRHSQSHTVSRRRVCVRLDGLVFLLRHRTDVISVSVCLSVCLSARLSKISHVRINCIKFPVRVPRDRGSVPASMAEFQIIRYVPVLPVL